MQGVNTRTPGRTIKLSACWMESKLSSTEGSERWTCGFLTSSVCLILKNSCWLHIGTRRFHARGLQEPPAWSSGQTGPTITRRRKDLPEPPLPAQPGKPSGRSPVSRSACPQRPASGRQLPPDGGHARQPSPHGRPAPRYEPSSPREGLRRLRSWTILTLPAAPSAGAWPRKARHCLNPSSSRPGDTGTQRAARRKICSKTGHLFRPLVICS